MARSKNVALLCIFALRLFGGAAFAQGSTATLAGSVRDPQNLVVPDATLTIAGTENNFTRTVMTGPDGSFELAGLLPGDYKIVVSLTGFAREEVHVRLEVNQRVRLDVVLKAAGLTQQVEVTTTVPLLHVSDAVVGEVIDQGRSPNYPSMDGSFSNWPCSSPARTRRTARRWET